MSAKIAPSPLVRFLRDDPVAGLHLAGRIANQIKRPWTLDPADVVQDVYLTLLELGDSLPADWAPPRYVSVRTVLACRTVFRLGGRDAYYDEWQWSRRRWGDTVATVASVSTPTPPPDAPDRDTLYAELLSRLPEKLQAAAHLLFSGVRSKVQLAKALGVSERKAATLPRLVAFALHKHGLWHPSLFVLSKKFRPSDAEGVTNA